MSGFCRRSLNLQAVASDSSMKTSFPIFVRLLSAFVMMSAGTGFVYGKDVEKIYELPSLKYIHTVKLVISGEKLSGTLSSEEYGVGESASVKFTGIISGKVLTVKLAGDAELISIVAPDKDGMRTWRIGVDDGQEALFIPIIARGEPNPVEMPLALKL